MGFVAIFRLYIIVSHTSVYKWANDVLLIAAILSLLVATVYMVKVKNIKRMLAYSSIEHMALVTLGIAAGGAGYYAALLHLVLHAFVKSAMFFQFTQFYRVFKNKSVYHTGGYFKYNAAGATVLLLGFFSATAMPPSGLFVSEIMLFGALFKSQYYWILLATILMLTLIIWSFGKNIFKILFIPAIGFNDTSVPSINKWESVSQYFLLALTVYLALNPPAQFVNLIHATIQHLPI
jgi:hydrogenase-4 component F